jgi:hypothetical protein
MRHPIAAKENLASPAGAAPAFPLPPCAGVDRLPLFREFPMRSAPKLVLLSLLPLAGCYSSPDYDREVEEPDLSVVDRIRQQNDLETVLSSISGCNCTVDIRPKFVRVQVLPGPKGLPDAPIVRKMSDRIVETTGVPPSLHLITAPGGKLLFAGGEPQPQ